MPLAAALVLVVLILVVVLILILVIHFSVPPNILLGYPTVVCPGIYALSFGLNSRLIRSPAVIAAAIPPAVDFRPPINIPRKPSS